MIHTLKRVPSATLRLSAVRQRAHSLEWDSAGVAAPPDPPQAGFALITVLWLIAVLSSVVALGLAGTRLGFQASANRIVLTRARWAAEACAAIAQARWADHRLGDTAPVDLGRRTWCRWRVADPTARLNVNTIDRDVLARLLGDSVANDLVARRQGTPLASADEFATGAAASLLTVDGPGTVNANAAPALALLALPGLGPEAVERVTSRRAVGRRFTSLDELASDLSPGARAALLEHYADLARLLTFSAPQLVVTAEGWVLTPCPPLRDCGEGARGVHFLAATIELLVVPLPERIAVIRRRVRG